MRLHIAQVAVGSLQHWPCVRACRAARHFKARQRARHHRLVALVLPQFAGPGAFFFARQGVVALFREPSRFLAVADARFIFVAQLLQQKNYDAFLATNVRVFIAIVHFGCLSHPPVPQVNNTVNIEAVKALLKTMPPDNLRLLASIMEVLYAVRCT